MKFLRKLSAAVLAAALMLSLLPAASASEVYGPEVKTRHTAVAPGVAVTTQAVWGPVSSIPRSENYLTYTPGGSVRPVARWGDYLVSRRTLVQMAQGLEAEGLRVVGGINASFFEPNGCPIGVVVSGGRLLSANPEYQVVGFRADGSAVLGQMSVSLSASWTVPGQSVADEAGNITTLPPQQRQIALSGLNKIRNAGGYYLISGDYAPSTQNTLNGVDVVLRPEEAQRGLPLNGSVACSVAAVRASLDDASIPEGCFVLSMNAYSDASLLALLQELKPGDALTLTVSTPGQWGEVTEALSGLHDLIVDGAPNPNLPWDGRAPRTAVGVKGDGSVLFYTIDGRRSGHSVGATYTEMALRLIELGCVSAVALDGGGSTSFGTTWPGQDTFQLINWPSDGSARAVSTCLFLVQDAGYATGELGSWMVDAEGPVLAGARIPLSAVPVDTAGRAMAWDGELTWTAALGSIAPDGAGGWVYTAPAEEGTAADVITVTGGGVTGTATLTVAGSPTALRLSGQSGTGMDALTLEAGGTAQLTASAALWAWPVTGRGGMTWSASPEVGTVTQDGLFTAGAQAGSGTLTVQAGTASLTIPVTVTQPEPQPDPDPFADIAQHWAKEDILRLYELGITQGSTGPDGNRYFYPGNQLTRQEWAVFLVRLLGEDAASYEDVSLPFADAAQIDSWALPYVRAAYALGLMNGSQTGQGLMANARASITREEAMTVVGRAMGAAQEADLSVYADADQVSAWALPHVQTLVAQGVVQGSGGRLNPKAPITRAEAAKILSRVLGT